MEFETIDEYVARGGEIINVPMGVSSQNVMEYDWSQNSSMGILSKEKEKAKAKVLNGTELQDTYLKHMKENPEHKQRHVAAALDWTATRVNDVRKSCIRSNLLEPAQSCTHTNTIKLSKEEQILIDYIKTNPGHRRREIALGLDWLPEKVSEARKRCVNKGFLDVSKINPIRTDTRKQCSKCRELKPFSEFSNNKSKSDGISSACKPCTALQMKAYRETKRINRIAKWAEDTEHFNDTT